MFASIRQLLYPPELRFRREPMPDSAALSLIEEIRRGMEAGDGGSDKALDRIRRIFAEVGTGLWRLRRKLVQSGTDQPREEMRSAYRHFESVWDVLSQSGLEIRDHTGEPVPETGTYALKVVTYEPTAGLTREQIVETVKPSIYWNGDTLQVGEVIVGTPIDRG